MNETLSVTLITLGTALATGLGAFPFFFTKKLSSNWLTSGNAVAAGCMTGASALLLSSGFHISTSSTVIGIVAGFLFIVLTQFLLKRAPAVAVHDMPQADIRKMLLIVIVMTVHSLSEGVGIGVAFGNGAAFGLVIALAMAIHNIPEGLAIGLVLFPRGVPALQVVGWSIFSSLPQLLAIPAFIFVEHFHPFLPIGLGFAAGSMLWLVASELLPDAFKSANRTSAGLIFAVSTVAMILIERYI
jgi:ZIP family zinc transporter